MNRRSLLKWATSGAAYCSLATPELSFARAREYYGGQLRLSLPLSLVAVDPHSSTDLSAGLLGRALFEAPYARTDSGRPYPTLAVSMPLESKEHFTIELRSGLRFSDGRKVEAKECVLAIRRSQSLSSALKSLGPPLWSRNQPRRIRFAKKATTLTSGTQIAATLANPRAAILPADFHPETPIGCGALKVAQRTRQQLSLVRNEKAPRGGSFIDSLIVTSASIRDCLRAFESGRSDLGFLGSGLHQSRRDSESFSLSPLGFVTLQAGSRNHAFQRPGLIHGALSHLPRAPFEALATHRVRSTPMPWRSPPVSILVNRDEPWLHAIAQELAQTWSAAGSRSVVDVIASKDFESRSGALDYDLRLSAICTSEQSQSQSSADLFTLTLSLIHI